MSVLLLVLARFVAISVASYLLGRSIQISLGVKNSYLASLLGVGVFIIVFSITQTVFDLNWQYSACLFAGLTVLMMIVSILRSYKGHADYLSMMLPSKEVLAIYVLQATLIVLICSPFIIRGYESVSGYLINHDSTVHNIITQQLAGLLPTEATVINDLNLSTYPRGFHILQSIITVASGQEPIQTFYFTLAFMYSLTIFPLYGFGHLFKRNSTISLVLGILPLLIPFGLQTLMSGFAGQVAVLPFLAASLLSIFELFTKKRSLYNYLTTAIFIVAAITVYQYTVLSILIPFGVVLAIMYLPLSKDALLKYFVTLVKDAAIVLGLVFILQPQNIFDSIHFLFSQASAGDEGGLFNVIGNSIGYPSLLNLLGHTWTTDYRILTSNKWLLIFSIFLLIGSLAVITYLIAKERRSNLGKFIAALNIAFLPLMFVAKYLFESPYFFTKALQFYSTFFVFSALLGFIYLCYQRAYWKQLVGLSAVISLILIFLWNDYKTMNSISLIPRRVHEDVNQFIDEYGSCLYLDDTDWGSYMLTNCTSRAVSRANVPLSQENTAKLTNSIEYDPDNHIQIQSEYDFIVVRKLASLSKPLRDFEEVGQTDNYIVYKKNRDRYDKVPLEVKQANILILPGDSFDGSAQERGNHFYIDMRPATSYILEAEELVKGTAQEWHHWDANQSFVYTYGKVDGENGISLPNLTEGDYKLSFSGIKLDLCVSQNSDIQRVGSDNEIIISSAQEEIQIEACDNESADNVMYLDNIVISHQEALDTSIQVCQENMCKTFITVEALEAELLQGDKSFSLTNFSNYPILLDGIEFLK